MEGVIKIGQLASAAGVTCDTVRYYERLRLLPRATRTHSGYRLYSSADVERLRFIKQAQGFGFTLDEIRDLLPGRGAGLDDCRKVHDLLKTKIGEIDQRMGELRAFRATLGRYFEECESVLKRKGGDSCPVLFEIAHRPSGDSESAQVQRGNVLKQKRGVKK